MSMVLAMNLDLSCLKVMAAQQSSRGTGFTCPAYFTGDSKSTRKSSMLERARCHGIETEKTSFPPEKVAGPYCCPAFTCFVFGEVVRAGETFTITVAFVDFN